MTMDHGQIVKLFKALGDENRIQILCMLQGGEKCACKLLEELNISQSTLSHHMKILCDAGIVVGRKEGKWMQYSICCECAQTARALLQESISVTHVPKNCDCEGK